MVNPEFEMVGTILRLKLDVIALGIEVVACVNLHIRDGHCRIEDKTNGIRQAIKHQFLGQFDIGLTVSNIIKCHVSCLLVKYQILGTSTPKGPSTPRLIAIGFIADLNFHVSLEGVRAKVTMNLCRAIVQATQDSIID